MTEYTRDYYLELARDRYFGTVMKGEVAPVLDAFTPDARIDIYNGDNRSQAFHRAQADGLRPFETFFGHLMGNYTALFEHMTFVIDPVAHTGAAIFVVTIAPKPGSDYTDTLVLNNANFFWFKDGLIGKMVIYYSNPTLGASRADTQGPTPFPRA